jgi:hypothetical protein
MTILRENLLMGCFTLGLIYLYIPVFSWLRLRHYYPNGGMPWSVRTRLMYGLFLLVGIGGCAGTVYILLHPALRSLKIPLSVLYGLGAAGAVLLIGAALHLPKWGKAMATLDKQPPAVRDSLIEADQIMSGRSPLKVRIRLWIVTAVFLLLFGAVYYYEHTVNAPADDPASVSVD